jgi:AhpD family alkylhydroperoxidase
MTSPMTDVHLPPPLALNRLTPDALDALGGLASDTTARARAAGLDPRLLQLVSLRASQLNGCHFCIGLHTQQAYAAGEREERLAALAAWPDSSLFDEAERAALALCEAVTRLPEGHARAAVRRAAGSGFDESQLAHLLWLITLVNAYNGLAVASGQSDGPAARSTRSHSRR